jgi:hypothetical protein
LLSVIPAAESLQTPGYVSRGAFVLERHATGCKSGRTTYQIIGYLPVGTVVYYDGARAPSSVYNYAEKCDEWYLDVESDIGVGGLIRVDRMAPIEADLLVPVCGEKVTILLKIGWHPSARDRRWRSSLL